jgi:hypothetical protein
LIEAQKISTHVGVKNGGGGQGQEVARGVSYTIDPKILETRLKSQETVPSEELPTVPGS